MWDCFKLNFMMEWVELKKGNSGTWDVLDATNKGLTNFIHN